jgi:arginine decarboxylase
MMEIVHKYGTPLKLVYLPKISSQIQKTNRFSKKPSRTINTRGSISIVIARRVPTFHTSWKKL